MSARRGAREAITRAVMNGPIHHTLCDSPQGHHTACDGRVMVAVRTLQNRRNHADSGYHTACDGQGFITVPEALYPGPITPPAHTRKCAGVMAPERLRFQSVTTTAGSGPRAAARGPRGGAGAGASGRGGARAGAGAGARAGATAAGAGALSISGGPVSPTFDMSLKVARYVSNVPPSPGPHRPERASLDGRSNGNRPQAAESCGCRGPVAQIPAQRPRNRPHVVPAARVIHRPERPGWARPGERARDGPSGLGRPRRQTTETRPAQGPERHA